MTERKSVHATIFGERPMTVCGLDHGRFGPLEMVDCWECLRVLVRARDGFACVDCGSGKHLTLGHIVARANGGLQRIDNLVTQCRDHRSRLGSRTWEPGWDTADHPVCIHGVHIRSHCDDCGLPNNGDGGALQQRLANRAPATAERGEG